MKDNLSLWSAIYLTWIRAQFWQKAYTGYTITGLSGLLLLTTPVDKAVAGCIALTGAAASIGYSQGRKGCVDTLVDSEALQARIKELNEQILERSEEISSLKTEIENKTAEFAKLRESDKEALQTQLKELEREFSIKHSELEDNHTLRMKDLDRIYAEKGLNQETEFVSRMNALEQEYKDKTRHRESRLGDFIKKVRDKLKSVEAEKTQLENLLKATKQHTEDIEKFFNDHLEMMSKKLEQADFEFKKTVSAKDLEIKRLSLALAVKPKSRGFNGGCSASITGNRLIQFLESKGIVTTGIEAKPGRSKDTILLESQTLLAEFEKQSEEIQQRFALLSEPEFKLEGDKIRITWQHTNAEKTETDIRRYCKSYTEFEEIIRKWERIKIDGGSESGKSPLAENIIGLKSRDRECKVILSNPLDGSRKDNWKIEPKFKTFGEASKGLAEAKNELHERSTKAKLAKELNHPYPNFDFHFYVFDEIDITLRNGDSHDKSNLLEILKTASHYDLGIIFLGQSPYSSDAGLKQADFANCVQIHIGRKVILKAIDLSFKGELEQKLLSQFETINRYYEEKNRYITDEKIKYRFALVEDDREEPYFIELPPIGYYTFDADKVADKVADTAESMGEEKPVSAVSNVYREGVTTVSAVMTEKSLCCPSCKSANVKRHSRKGDKIQLRCLNEECSKKYFTLPIN